MRDILADRIPTKPESLDKYIAREGRDYCDFRLELQPDGWAVTAEAIPGWEARAEAEEKEFERIESIIQRFTTAMD
jgi:hypothetical protein